MKPTVLLDSAPIPDTDKELRLYQHDKDFMIKLGNLDLMNSRMHGSEEVLAELSCKPIANQPEPRILIGGLGMGFTLRAALDFLPANAEAVVAEIVPAVVKWNRGVLAHLSANAVEDPRVKILEDDVTKVIRAAAGDYNAILLDVDNGPKAFSRKGNAALYSLYGLRRALAALRPQGILAIWAIAPDREFTQLLRKAGFHAEEVRVRARSGAKGGAHYLIWVAKRS
jgi:spermidine synthase